MDDFPRDCLGVWTNRKYSSIAPQHVAIGEEESSQGVATIYLLCDDAGHTDGGPGVARGMESGSDPKDSARRTNLEA
jgi:hypothetical protein